MGDGPCPPKIFTGLPGQGADDADPAVKHSFPLENQETNTHVCEAVGVRGCKSVNVLRTYTSNLSLRDQQRNYPQGIQAP